MGQSDKKYEFTGETLRLGGKVFHRIRALKNFGNVQAGYLGGYIEKEENLSQEGLAWVDFPAKVHDDALVSDDAQVYGNARVFQNARVSGNAQVCDNAWILENAWIRGNARVCQNAKIVGCADIRNNDGLLVVGGIGPAYDTATFFVSPNAKIYVTCGCFSGTLDKFEAEMLERHGDDKYGAEYRTAIKLAKQHIWRFKE